MKDDEQHKDVEGGGASFGVPAEGSMDVGAREPMEAKGMHHWRESTITEPGLHDRGNVFFAAIEMTRMPMILTDPNQPDDPIVFANKAFLDLTGYEDDEVLGRNCRFLQGAHTDREAVAELRSAVAERRSVALELLNYRRDGSPFWNAVFIGPVYDVSGKLLYFFASQLDVTRRRNSEQSFRQAQKLEAIGQLTAGLAHDFNNLLQVVNGNLELLEARVGDGDPRTGRYLASARAAAERGAKLTKQLLAFARKTRLDPHAVDLSTLIEDFSEMIESSVGGLVSVSLELASGLPDVLIDVEQLEMALLNVVLNARDAMPGGGTVTVATRALTVAEGETRQDLAAGDYVAVEVRDEGTGMSADVIERATEPFFTTKAANSGTGLGLAMANGFVRQSQGRLEIESEVGHGTTVRMIFPRSTAVRPHTLPEKTEPPVRALLSDQPAEHVLIVEDSGDVLALAEEILTAAGYRVSVATNADEALERFDALHAENPVNLLFTDLLMPGSMNGLRLAEEVHRRAPEVCVLMTTGYNEELVVDGSSHRDADVIGKPYRRAELLDRVRQALNRQHGDEPRRHPSDFGHAEA